MRTINRCVLNICLVLLFYRIGGAETVGDENFFVDPPQIEGWQEDFKRVPLTPGSDYLKKCESDSPITWKAFKGFKGEYQITYTEVENAKFRYETSLNLINITYHYVGYFFCVTNRTESNFDYSVQMSYEIKSYSRKFSGVDAFYVFVNDVDHRLVYRDPPEVTIVNDNLLILTCKPTMSNTVVKLYDKRTEAEVDVKDYVKDPVFGFAFHFHNSAQMYGKSFECRDDRGSSISFDITYRLPEIQSETGVHGTIGKRLTLCCSLPVLNNEDVDIKWKLPNETNVYRANITVQERGHPRRSDVKFSLNILTINYLNLDDEGNYECEVDLLGKRVSDRIFIEVFDETDDVSLEIYTLDGNTTVEVSRWSDKAVLQARYKGKPQPILEWHDRYGQIIEDYSHFNSGNYTLKAKNSLSRTDKTFQLLVKERPKIKAPSNHVVAQMGQVASFTFKINAYPMAAIVCTITPCIMKEEPFCDGTQSTQIANEHIQTTMESEVEESVVLHFYNATKFSQINCKVVNTEGIESIQGYLVIDKIKTKLRVIGPDKMISGDNATLTCEGDSDIYKDLQFLHDGHTINSEGNRKIKRLRSDSLHILRITWNGISSRDAGTYTCLATDSILHFVGSTNSQTREDVQILVLDLTVPTIDGQRRENVSVILAQSARLYCNFGLPAPEIVWYKDGVLIKNRTKYAVEGQSLVIENAQVKDSGTYKCVGTNRMGSDEKYFKVEVITNFVSWVAGVVSLVLLLALIICTVVFLQRLRRFQRALADAGLDHFDDGNLESINPNLALHEQANLLPYNRKYEFPRNHLKLGKQLGDGAFGVVVEAWATGIVSRLEETKVAVKMLKDVAGNEEIRALVTELKILVNLGQNVNIVNLLGAVTKNITKREIMVIVEYCRFGSLQDFLIKHRDFFVNQINSENDSIDATISKSVCFHSMDPSEPNQPLAVVDSGYSETSFTASNSDENRFITTSDLVCWLFQMARGMKYLASRKVLHGDLAARNVLLTDGNVVKICDFGLARSLYKQDHYKKENDGPLPIRWLAIESICDRIFSTSSDVWSFGIVMWEFFSLGAMPYPHFGTNETLIGKLLDGYRMGKPHCATRKIYDIMLHCWNLDPESRPTFEDLESKFGDILEADVAKHYVDLNLQYVEMNAKTFGQGQTDYLALIGQPQEVKSSNCKTNVGSNSTSLYLPMKPI